MKDFFNKRSKLFKSIVKTFGFFIGLIIIVMIIDYGWIFIRYQGFKKKSQDSFPVYGTLKGYVPQGLAYSDSYNVVLQTSYNKKQEVSMLYVIDFSTGELLKALALEEIDGSNNIHHVGGVATDNKRVWISGDYEINQFDLETIMNTEQNSIRSTKNAKLTTRGDFCYYNENILWVGDFYVPIFYEVLDKKPLLWAFNTNSLDFEHPQYIISIPNRVQGMAIENGTFYFTQSFSAFMNSKLNSYQNVLSGPHEILKVNGYDVYYYRITKNELLRSITLPPMAEGIFYRDESFFILFENGSSSYPQAFPKFKNVIQYKK